MLTEDQLNHLRRFASPLREKGFTRTIYSYPAKFLSHLPRELIKMFSKEGDQICDPFTGGGTTGLESMILNRRFIGYDINPFALLIARVKSTHIPEEDLKTALEEILINVKSINGPSFEYFDSIDKECLGKIISTEISKLASVIEKTDLRTSVKDFFKLALIHVVKIIGRRDFEERKNWAGLSMIPMFIRKTNKMITAVSALPFSVQYPPEFFLGSNHKMDIPTHSIDFILTSPPYLEVDVEYQQIQIQRRSLGKSKRTDFINKLLRTDPLAKKDLCWTGKGGNLYWSNLEKSLNECYRILKPNHYLCLWTGVKKEKDREKLMNTLQQKKFRLISKIEIPQSDNRAASSRSTHHERVTKMFKQDSIFILQS